MQRYTLKCYDCGTEHDEQQSVTTCFKCGGQLEVYYDYEAITDRLNVQALKTAPVSAMKYLPFYPIDNYKNVYSLQEGGTPLIHAKKLGESLGLKQLFIKNEGLNPTGVFKDRGTLVEIAKARELGATAICLASTGNMAASCAAYAQIVGLPCYVLVPQGTPVGKLAQTLISGARVIQIRGTYSDCARLAQEMAKRFGYYLAGDYAFRAEGQKSQGYEIVEQLFWKSPDYVVCPVGCGTNLHGIGKGLREYLDLGFSDKMPRLVGVQTPGCNPIVDAYKRGTNQFKSVAKPNTLASAIAAGTPLDGHKVLDDIFASEGFAMEVTDDQTIAAQLNMMRLGGVFGEPSGALGVAAVEQLVSEGKLKADDTIVVIVTGNGLKDPKTPLDALPEPPSIEPDFGELESFIENKLYAIHEQLTPKAKQKVVFKTLPDQEQLHKVITKELGIEVNEHAVTEILAEVHSFMDKGKTVSKSDLVMIVEEVLDKQAVVDPLLTIVDFEINTSLHHQATAKIKVTIGGEDKQLMHSGVGPVDAAISALRDGLDGKLMAKLTDYTVNILTGDIDATVEVKMTLVDGKRNNKVVSRATSPDVIVASLKAYEKGINLLWAKIK